MTTRTKSALTILSTLVLGIVIGGLGASAIISSRSDQFRRLRMQGGPREMIEEVLRPVSPEQQSRIAAALDSMAQRHGRLRESTSEHHAAIIDSLRAELAPILTAEQLDRFDRWQEQDRRAGGGPPPGFGPPHGPHGFPRHRPLGPLPDGEP